MWSLANKPVICHNYIGWKKHNIQEIVTTAATNDKKQ